MVQKQAYLFLFLLAFTGTSVFAQIEFNFDISRLEEVLKEERKYESVITDTTDFGILSNPLEDIETTIQTDSYIFKRTKDTFEPQLHVWYHIDKKDKHVRAITYNWGLYNPAFNANKNRELLEKLSKREKEFDDKFQTLQEYITSIYGESDKGKITDRPAALLKSMYWENSQTIAKLSMDFQREIIEIPGMGLITNHFNVQVMIYYK